MNKKTLIFFCALLITIAAASSLITKFAMSTTDKTLTWQEQVASIDKEIEKVNGEMRTIRLAIERDQIESQGDLRVEWKEFAHKMEAINKNTKLLKEREKHAEDLTQQRDDILRKNNPKTKA